MQTVIVSVLSAFFAANAIAQTAGPPSYSIGDTWTYVETDLLTGLKLSELKYVVTALRDGRTYRTLTRDGATTEGFWVPDLSFSGFEMFKWPLTVGAKWKSGMKRRNPECGLMTDAFDAEVKSYGEIETKAGRFNVFHVEHNGYYSFDVPMPPRCNNGPRVWSYWYSPEVKRIVQFEEHRGTTRIRQELTQYLLAPR